MNKRVLVSLVLAVAAIVILSAPVRADQESVSADDFLAPRDGGAREVAQPDKVQVRNELVEGATAQDAVNAAIARTKKGLAAGEDGRDSLEIHARLVKFPSGIGVVASGVAGYEDTGDAVLTRISQRNAYTVAFMQAKQNLATFLRGLSHESEGVLSQNLANISSAAKHLNNLGNDNRLTVKQAAESLLRGFVVYEIDDDTAAKMVYVSVVTTPKTRGRLSRSSPVSLDAASLQEGLNHLLAEVKSGVTFPVGGRVITVSATGETAVVGFGSYVVRTDTREAVGARLRLEAQRTSAVLAQDSLCGMLLGDKMAWEGKVSDRVAHMFEDFQDPAKGDPLPMVGMEDVRSLDRRREAVVAEARSANSYRSVRRGQLPPGVVLKTWFNEDMSWAFGVAVYLPGVTKAVSQVAREMDQTELLVPLGDAPAGKTTGEAPAGRSGDGHSDRLDSAPSAPPVQRGPTGKLDPNDL